MPMNPDDELMCDRCGCDYPAGCMSDYGLRNGPVTVCPPCAAHMPTVAVLLHGPAKGYVDTTPPTISAKVIA